MSRVSLPLPEESPRHGAGVQGAPRRYASGYAAPGHHHHDEVRGQDEGAGEVWAQPPHPVTS